MSSTAPAELVSSSTFSCNTCGIKFAVADLQRQHMKTEWHRYNLKRKVAQLPSISSDLFAEKLLSSQRHGGDEPEVDEFGFPIDPRGSARKLISHRLRKQTRGRPFGVNVLRERSESPFSLESRHSEFSLGDSVVEYASNTETGSEFSATESELSDRNFQDSFYESDYDSDADSDSVDIVQSIPISYCFFCGQNNGEVENNVKHMFNKHGLYIPERSYLVDLEGLLSFLSEIISVDHECLVCNFLGKNLVSIRQHMHSKGHCRIPYESKDEKESISEFYDFNVSEPKPKSLPEHKSVSFKEEDDQVLVDIDSEISSGYSTVHVDPSGVELTLPTGSRIGHRSMMKYYRQNMALPRLIPDSEKTVALSDRRFAPGVTTREVQKQEKRTRIQVQKAQNVSQRRWKPERMNYQKHFRDELLGTL